MALLCLAAWSFTLKTLFTAQAQSAPVIISVTLTNGAVNMATNGAIVLVFDQDMKTVIPIASIPGSWVGNFAIAPTNVLSASGVLSPLEPFGVTIRDTLLRQSNRKRHG